MGQAAILLSFVDAIHLKTVKTKMCFSAYHIGDISFSTPGSLTTIAGVEIDLCVV
jgi:hypothetical protein